MNSAHALELTNDIINNNPEKAGSLLVLLSAIQSSRGDPEAELMADEVMDFLYAKTEHFHKGRKEFISQESRRLQLVA